MRENPEAVPVGGRFAPRRQAAYLDAYGRMVAHAQREATISVSTGLRTDAAYPWLGRRVKPKPVEHLDCQPPQELRLAFLEKLLKVLRLKGITGENRVRRI